VTEPGQSKCPLVIGLTGGIASGKSTIAGFFAELGVPIIDTDVIAREIVTSGSPVLDEIRDRFGDTVITGDGSLDRQAMRQLVFRDRKQRLALESILHPRIRQEAYSRAAETDAAYVIIVVPLLYESPMREAMDRILVVDCNEETQLQRLLERDNETREQACRIMATQASREQRLSIADDIISNDGDRDDARRGVASLHSTYLELAGQQE